VKTRFQDHIETNFPELLQTPFLLACSGGVDSMVLWRLCLDSGLHFEVAHCDFGLRGPESTGDAEFVSAMGEAWDTVVHVKCFQTKAYAKENKQTLQESARLLRYGWFRELAASRGLSFTVTAHQADDELETFLINLIRGTGLEGLGGIPPRAEGVRRPLLPYPRQEIHAYATQMDIPWREDTSNASDKYLRNRLRNAVIPPLKAADPRAMGNFRKSLAFLQGSRALVRNHVAEIRSRVFVEENELVRIPLAALRELNPREPYLYELFRPYGFTDWEALGRLLDGVAGRQVRSGTHRLLRDREALLLKPITIPDREVYSLYPERSPEALHIPLELDTVSRMENQGPSVLYVDRETLKKGLQVRKWKNGDYFYPLGMGGRQKVAKYFKDHKFSLFEKEAQWILCSGSQIVWLVGHRADERFKVQEHTDQILRIQWKG
jgi:tRNA(Ile)-lysidine synthase